MHTLKATATLVLLASVLFTSCYTARVTLGPTCQAAMNNEDGYWKDIEYKDTVLRMKAGQLPIITKPCGGLCVCRMEYKVGFGNVMATAFTLGFVRRVKVRYACCQPTNN